MLQPGGVNVNYRRQQKQRRGRERGGERGAATETRRAGHAFGYEVKIIIILKPLKELNSTDDGEKVRG